MIFDIEEANMHASLSDTFGRLSRGRSLCEVRCQVDYWHAFGIHAVRNDVK